MYYRGTYRSVSTEDESDTRRHSIFNPLPIRFKSVTNPLPILCKSIVNPVSIQCRHDANPISIKSQSIPIQCRQSGANLKSNNQNKMQIPSKSDVTQCKSSVNLMPIKCQLMPIYANLTSNQCQLQLDWHASAQITPILY